MLCGCTDKDAGDLLPLAKSWLRAPQILLSGSPLIYRFEERAYEVNAAGKGTLELEVLASGKSPARGICLLVKGWKETLSSVCVGGKILPAENVKSGNYAAYDGNTLVVWIDASLDRRTSIVLK